MDTTSTIFIVLITVIILLIVYSAQVAVFYGKMVRRVKILPDISPDTIKSFAIAILTISLAWWIKAVIITDCWKIVVIGLFILLIMFVIWKIDNTSAKRQKKDINEAVKAGIVEGIKEVERRKEEVKQEENISAKP